MKKFLLSILFLFLTFSIYSQNKSQIQKFIKGNIVDKTAAVREASGEEAVWLSNKAILFALENQEYLENDRDLEGLAVAAIFSISKENVKTLQPVDKSMLVEEFIQLFNKFDSSNTVQISILSKILILKDDLNLLPFVKILNTKISSPEEMDISVAKAILNSLEGIGNSESFVAIFNLWNNPKYNFLKSEIESALTALIPLSMNETLALLRTKDVNQLTKIFYLIKENPNISKNSLCEIAENVLNESILIIDSSSKITAELITIQLDSVQILNENKWTRASSLALTFFNVAQKEYEAKLISEDDFTKVISSLLNLAPIYAVTPLTGYLEELNNQKEDGTEVSLTIVLSVIKTLGAIGDKSAFDSLLAVTYLNYPENVLSAAREALTGLRW